MVEEEIEPDEPQITAMQIKEQLVELIKGSEFGSPQYLAECDYLHLHELEDDLKRVLKELFSKIEQSTSKIYSESKVRITEQQIALIKNQIYQHRSQLKGYDSTYTNVEMIMESSLPDALRRDGERLFGENRQQREFFESDFYYEVFEEVHMALYDKSQVT